MLVTGASGASLDVMRAEAAASLIARMEALLQDWIVQFKQPIYAERVTLCTVHILVCLVSAHPEILSNLPVRDTGFLQMKKLLDLAHVNDCSCHIPLPVLNAAKLGDLT